MSKPKVDTDELCKELVRIAGFANNESVRKKIYTAVRQLQLLDKLAKEASHVD
jgi:hypothetical protein